MGCVLVSCEKQKPPNVNAENEALAQRIIGTWSDSVREDHIQFFNDGSLANYGGKGKDRSKWKKVSDGKWKVVGGNQIVAELVFLNGEVVSIVMKDVEMIDDATMKMWYREGRRKDVVMIKH